MMAESGKLRWFRGRGGFGPFLYICSDYLRPSQRIIWKLSMSAIEGCCVNLKGEWNHDTFARHKSFCFQIPIALLGLAKIWAISHGLAEKLARHELLTSNANFTWISIISPIYSARHLSFPSLIISTTQEISFQQSTLHINTKSKLLRTKTQDTIT